MEPVGLTPGRQPVALHGLHDSVPKAEKPPWKAASSQALDSVVHFSNEISRFPEPARKGPRQAAAPSSCARALSVGRVALPRGRRRVAAPDAAVVMATSASAIGPARPHYVAPWRREAVEGRGEARERPPLLRMLREQSGRRFPPAPPSSPRSATPDVREGKNPRWSQVPARPTPPPNLASMVTGRLGRLLGMV